MSVVNTKPTIAVIDDEPEILEMYQDLFSEEFTVLSFGSPTDFLTGITNKTIPQLCLVISDYNMPKMTGLQMIEKGHALGARFPSLLLSGYVSKDVAVSALNMGINKVLEKPAPPDAIFKASKDLIKNFRLHNIENQMMEIGDQLSELYLLYRDILMPQFQDTSGAAVLSEDGTPEGDSPLAVVSQLERQMVRLQMEKKVLSQLD